ncbi:HAD-like domain-containing protein [Melampsora americana]|nr:HAD-like domain-containing protein [Melampsora americana]
MTDVDGTFITDDHLVHEKTRLAIQHIRSNHPQIPIIIATGKHRSACDWFIKELGFDSSPAASCHGAILHDPFGKMISIETLKPQTALSIIEVAKTLNRTCFLFTPNDVVLVYEETNPKRDWLSIVRKIERNLIDGQDESFLQKVKTGEVKVIKVTIPVEESSMSTVQTAFSNLLFESHPELTSTTALPFVLEIVQASINKSVALKHFCHQFDCQPDQVLAFGDGMNDLEMLSEAGYGVAMGNADERLKSVAKYVTLSNNEGGVGVFLDRIFKKDESDLK